MPAPKKSAKPQELYDALLRANEEARFYRGTAESRDIRRLENPQANDSIESRPAGRQMPPIYTRSYESGC